MRVAMWTYPWDVQDLTADRVTADLREAGADTVSLATSYHAGRFLQARSPVRKTYFPEDGTIYFRPTPRLWADQPLQPQVSSVVSGGGDALADLVRRRDEAGGLRVSGWTVCLHNSRLGALHPDVVTRNCFDEPSTFNLCPSHPAARSYAAMLVEDLSSTYRLDAIELESAGFMGYAHGHHHEKDGVGLLPEDDLLLSLCFCPACLARAARAKVDGARAKATVRRWVEEALERPVPAARWPELASQGPAAFAAAPEVHEYLLWRFEPVTSLVAEIRERAAAATDILTIDLEDGWLGGSDLGAVTSVCDGAILCAYDMSPERVSAMLHAGRATVGPDKFLGTGFRLVVPEMRGAADVAARTAAAIAAGCDGINYYNYGLVPRARLDWIRQGLDRGLAS